MKRKFVTYVKVSRPIGRGGLGERWARCDVAPTLNLFDCGDVRTTVAIIAIKPKYTTGKDERRKSHE